MVSKYRFKCKSQQRIYALTFLNEPVHGKTNNLHMRKQKTQISCAVTAQLISAFVFDTRIVQFLFYFYPKFQASSLLLSLYRPVCVGPGRNPNCWFSHAQAQMESTMCRIDAEISLTFPSALFRVVLIKKQPLLN